MDEKRNKETDEHGYCLMKKVGIIGYVKVGYGKQRIEK
jgi:hypothetical protein